MRIISGKYGSKTITFPANLPVRPTTDYAKSGLFNILRNHFDFSTIRVLDLFAGSGGITYEFISNGCEDITAVDKNPACVKFIKETATRLPFENIYVIKADALSFLKNNTETFEIIFADPPYDFNLYPELISLVLRNTVLKENGWFIMEHLSDKNFNNYPEFIEKRKYGNVGFTMFKNSA